MLTIIITFTGLPLPKLLQLLMVLQIKNELTVGPEGEEAVRQSSSEERSVGLEDQVNIDQYI